MDKENKSSIISWQKLKIKSLEEENKRLKEQIKQRKDSGEYSLPKHFTIKDIKCPKCKAHCFVTYVNGKECSSCGYVN